MVGRGMGMGMGGGGGGGVRMVTQHPKGLRCSEAEPSGLSSFIYHTIHPIPTLGGTSHPSLLL